MQRVVVISGVAMGVVGQVVTWLLPFAPGWRLLGCITCVAMVGTELRRMHRSWASYPRARLAHDGSAELQDAEGSWQPAELLPGSMLLRHYGWLRLQPRHGRRFVALYRGHCRESADWRRLQVIWSHVGAAP